MTIKSTNHLTHIATFCALLYSNSALCAELVEYDHTFLMGKDASNIDLSRYTEGNPTLPGIYDVSVYVNDQLDLPLYIQTFFLSYGCDNFLRINSRG
ncbi:FimD/PapC N-terminal domain-containing protein, partial [Escherichia coli]|uniref:FimD/PapC N-terminal domain-containing protein n=1 Tax=Escherichia coli TaxID=562 RepID=UPI0024DF1BC8